MVNFVKQRDSYWGQCFLKALRRDFLAELVVKDVSWGEGGRGEVTSKRK